MKFIICQYEKCAPDKVRLRQVTLSTSVHFIVSGSGYFNGRRLGAGEGFFTVKNENNDYYPDKNDPWTYFWVRLTDDEAVFSENLLTQDRTFKWHGDGSDFALLEKEINGSDYLYALGRTYMLLSKIDKSEDEPSESEKRFEEIRDYIKCNFAEIESLKEVAERFSITRAYMRNLFYSFASVSPQSFLITTRIERAKELLKTGIPISIVSTSVGYGDQLQFSRLFKKHVGVSPSEYEKRAKRGIFSRLI